jgi:DNA-binding transcriptional MerR regulator
VLCIDRQAHHGQGFVWNHIPYGAEDFTGDIPLQERVDLLRHASFFIGLASGLSWLAWAAGWIDNGVQVSKVKTLLSEQSPDEQDIWREQQEVLLRYLQSGHLHRLRLWLKERGNEYPAQTLISHLFIPLRRRLQSQQPTLQALLSALDGVLINYICICLATARKKNSKDALVIGWNVHDTTRLWLEAWIAAQQGWRVDVLAHSLGQLRPELFDGQTLLVWCGESPTEAQQQQLNQWREHGYPVFSLNGN